MSENISSGIVSLFGDGEVFNVLADVKYSMATVKVTVVRGVNGHYSERHEPMTPYIELTISDSGDLDTGNLSGRRFDVIQLPLLNGKTPKLNKAIQVNQVEVDAIEGSTTVRFEGTADPDEDLAS
jgi:hypothetical protein